MRAGSRDRGARARVINFGSDSFLGLDQDPRVQRAIRLGLKKWGSHNGSSRAFASVRANLMPRRSWPTGWGSSCAFYPSVTLANLGAIPGLMGRHDAIAMDEMAHSSMQEAAKIAERTGRKWRLLRTATRKRSNKRSKPCIRTAAPWSASTGCTA